MRKLHNIQIHFTLHTILTNDLNEGLDLLNDEHGFIDGMEMNSR